MKRPRFDHRVMLLVFEGGENGPGSVRGVAQHLKARLLAPQQFDADRSVAGVGRGEVTRSDDPRVGLHSDMGLVTVPIARLRLVHVPRLRIDGGNHPVLGRGPRDTPRAVGPVRVGFDVLASDQRQQRDQLSLIVVESDALNRGEHRQRVVHEPAHQNVAGHRVVPRARRLGAAGVVMSGHHNRRGSLHGAAHPANHRHQLRHRVLRRHRVVQQRRIQRPAGLAPQHASIGHDPANRFEDPLRAITITQPTPPIRQHRRMEPLIIQRQPRSHLPTQISAQRLRRLPIRQTLQRLQHQHRRHHLSGHRQPAPTRTEQIGEQLIGKHPPPVISQKPVHRTSRNQMPDHRLSVQQLPIQQRHALHATSLPDPNHQREPFEPNYSAVS